MLEGLPLCGDVVGHTRHAALQALAPPLSQHLKRKDLVLQPRSLQPFHLHVKKSIRLNGIE